MIEIDARGLPNQIAEGMGLHGRRHAAVAQLGLLAVQQRSQQVIPAGKIVVHQRLADAGLSAQPLHRHGRQPFVENQARGVIKDLGLSQLRRKPGALAGFADSGRRRGGLIGHAPSLTAAPQTATAARTITDDPPNRRGQAAIETGDQP